MQFSLAFLQIDVVLLDVPILSISGHVSCGEIQAIVRHRLYSEVIKAYRLLEVSAAIGRLDNDLLCQVVIVKVAPDGLPIRLLDF